MKNTKVSVIITSHKEPETIKKAVDQILKPNEDLWNEMELIVTAPDNETLKSAQTAISNHPNFKNFKLVRDLGNGKPAALNLAQKEASGDILFLTDGDIYIDDDSIKLLLPSFDNEKIGGISGQPVSLNSRLEQFGYYSHLFCEAAHVKRLSNPEIAMSGYIYAFRNLDELFPIPEEIRAEDGYITQKLISLGYKIDYEPNAKAYVKFPTTLGDWFSQKIRSLGGNIQLKLFTANLAQNNRGAQRSISQDLNMALFPIKFASNPIEIAYSLILYPLRLILWGIIYMKHLLRAYKSGPWRRIESTK